MNFILDGFVFTVKIGWENFFPRHYGFLVVVSYLVLHIVRQLLGARHSELLGQGRENHEDSLAFGVSNFRLVITKECRFTLFDTLEIPENLKIFPTLFNRVDESFVRFLLSE